MESFVALGVPEGAVLLAVSTLVNLTSSTTISIGLVAVSTIIMEVRVMRAVLPADRTDTGVAIFTSGIAKGTISFLILGASGERFTSSAAGCLFPAGVRDISMVEVVMVMVDRGTIVVLLGVSEWLLRVMSKVRHASIPLRVVMMAMRRLIVTVKAAMVARIIIEVMLLVIVFLVAISELILFHFVVAMRIAAVVVQIVAMMKIVVLLVKMLNIVMVYMSMLVVRSVMRFLVNIVYNSSVVIR